MPEHKGWYSRGYLPHRDEPGLLQMITFHLQDRVPLHLLQSDAEPARDDEARRALIESWLDQGWGACLLSDARVAQIVEDSLLYGDGQSYTLLAWVVMPNHVHVLIKTFPGMPLDRVVGAWKGYTAKKVNALLGRAGSLWRADYHDRYIRDEEHLENVLLYIHGNPARAGLVEDAETWRFGSARRLPTGRSMWHDPFGNSD